MTKESNILYQVESNLALDSAKIANNLRNLTTEKILDKGMSNKEKEEVVNFAKKLAYEVENYGGVLIKSDYGLIFNKVIIVPAIPKEIALLIMKGFKQNLLKVAFDNNYK
jgi:hypothetical protein